MIKWNGKVLSPAPIVGVILADGSPLPLWQVWSPFSPCLVKVILVFFEPFAFLWLSPPPWIAWPTSCHRRVIENRTHLWESGVDEVVGRVSVFEMFPKHLETRPLRFLSSGFFFLRISPKTRQWNWVTTFYSLSAFKFFSEGFSIAFPRSRFLD